MHMIQAVAQRIGALVHFEQQPVTVDFKPLMDALTAAFTPDKLLAVLASTVGIGVSFWLMWFGVRKISKVFFRSVESGRIKL